MYSPVFINTAFKSSIERAHGKRRRSSSGMHVTRSTRHNQSVAELKPHLADPEYLRTCSTKQKCQCSSKAENDSLLLSRIRLWLPEYVYIMVL